LPYYMHQWVYQNSTLRQMIRGEQKQNREEVVRLAIETFHGKLLNFFFCFGEYDGVCMTEFDDMDTAAACVMTILAQGNVSRIHTTPLMPQEQTTGAIENARKVFLDR
jgi:uncharacterized protein with GYD domain